MITRVFVVDWGKRIDVFGDETEASACHPNMTLSTRGVWMDARKAPGFGAISSGVIQKVPLGSGVYHPLDGRPIVWTPLAEDIAVRDRDATIEMNRELIDHLIRDKRMVMAIKLYREVYGVDDLMKAKKWVENRAVELGIKPAYSASIHFDDPATILISGPEGVRTISAKDAYQHAK